MKPLRFAVVAFALAVPMFVVAQVRFHFARVPEDEVWSRLEHSSRKNPEREQILRSMFSDAGCSGDRLSEEKVPHSSSPNLVCVIPGESDRTIIVGAHFDKVDAGDGIVDNWSGAAMLPSLIKAIIGSPRKHTYVFIGFTDEEKGLVGSDFHASHMNKEDRQKVSAMVNLDTVGLGPTEVWASQADHHLLDALAVVANSMKLPIFVMNVDGAGTTDSESFHHHSMPAVTIHSVTPKNFSILHSSRDTLQQIQRKDYLDTFRTMSGYLAYLDLSLDAAPSAGTSGK